MNLIWYWIGRGSKAYLYPGELETLVFQVWLGEPGLLLAFLIKRWVAYAEVEGTAEAGESS